MAAIPVTAIDSHAHVIAKDRPISSHRHAQPDRDHTAEELLAHFDRCGISHGLLTAPSFYQTDNSLLLETLDRHPRLRGTAIVAADATPAQLEALRARKVCGIRLNWWRKPGHPDIRDCRDLLARVRDAGLHVELLIEGQELPDILTVIEQSGAPVVLDHFGCPDPAEGVRSPGFRKMVEMMNAGRAWVKLSAPYRLGGGDPVAYARALLEQAGPERLVWASDWPWNAYEQGMSYERCLGWLEQWVPDPAARRIVLCDTPRALFGFD